MAAAERNPESNLPNGKGVLFGHLKTSEFISRLKNIKHIKTVVIIVLIAAMVGIYFIPLQKSKADEAATKDTETTAKEKTDTDLLEEILTNIQGAGKVDVMVTYENSAEAVSAFSTQTETSTVTEKDSDGSTKDSQTTTKSSQPVTVGSGSDEAALLLQEINPKVKGVIVVADGADDINVRLSLLKAVETVLQLSPSQVEIFARNKE